MGAEQKNIRLRDWGGQPNTKKCLYCGIEFQVFGNSGVVDDFCCRAHCLEFKKGKELRTFENELKGKPVARWDKK